MRIVNGEIRLAATDVSNHLACRHLTELELGVARGSWVRPEPRGAHLITIRELGARHEAKYLQSLKQQGLVIEDFGESEDAVDRSKATLEAMVRGAQVIAQGVLTVGRWFGRPDLLRKVERPSPAFGAWSYEVVDCKLAQETKATTVLQLACYSELVGEIQGVTPEFMYVVRRDKGTTKEEAFRVLEYDAYYRHVKEKLARTYSTDESHQTYPEPCSHCDVCVWFEQCDQRRHDDDHLSLVAGITKLQRIQLCEWNYETVEKLAEMPVPVKQKPLHGSREGLQSVREQARVQVRGRREKRPVHELRDIAAGNGFLRLPEPTLGDVFVDLEGDPFAGDCGQEYLFGFVALDNEGQAVYRKKWAFNPEQEKLGFEWLVDELSAQLDKYPNMNLYHFGHYEKTHLSQLAGQYATREREIDRFLRGERFVDLHAIFKQAVRASTEEYSLKKLEAFFGYERMVPLQQSRKAMVFIERRLELGWGDDELSDELREAMEGYNADDCFSLVKLRQWLEVERQKKIEESGEILRPEIKDGLASEKIEEREARVTQLAAQLSDGEQPQSPRWLLAQLLGWHRREARRSWQEGFRLAQLDDEELTDERIGLGRLRFMERLSLTRGNATERYSFEPQKTDIRVGSDLYVGKDSFGKVVAINATAGTIEIRKARNAINVQPTSVYTWKAPIATDAQEDSLFRLGQWVLQNGTSSSSCYDAVLDLLQKRSPHLKVEQPIEPMVGETAIEAAKRVGRALVNGLFAIQGPPGAGKTYTGARMICDLVAAGKKVGISAHSHKAIGKLLKDVQIAADEMSLKIDCIRKVGDDNSEEIAGIENTDESDIPLVQLQSGEAQVGAGTAWLWAKQNYEGCLDALFVDEAGQMALADVVAIGQASKNLILIGDPQQLQRPLKGSHPPGAEKSALEHLIGDRKTIEPSMGLLLKETRRMHPNVCAFTSSVFYDDKLTAHPVTHPYELKGHPWLNGAGLWFIPTEHSGNRNSAPEEIEVIAELVSQLLSPKVRWCPTATRERALTWEDILIVAPYNAQVSDLRARLPNAQIGTVDKFQGQEAAVVIYSLTTSTPEDAPRGMEFLYSLNRLNVATSRAMSN